MSAIIPKGCPPSALAPELGRSEPDVKTRIRADMVNYKDQLVRFMPGRRAVDGERAFFAMFATMIGPSRWPAWSRTPAPGT
jgi:TetR/AcrR family transcriptional regulator, transcriptional repressor for nem operon